MAEVLRKKIRKVLGQATAICLSIDECKHRKIIRFRADLPTAYCAHPGSHWRVGASGFSQAGVLGLLDCSKKDVTDFEEDHAVTAVRKLEEFLTSFCTPLGRRPGSRQTQPLACEEALKGHILQSVLVVAADRRRPRATGIFSHCARGVPQRPALHPRLCPRHTHCRHSVAHGRCVRKRLARAIRRTACAGPRSHELEEVA